MARRLFNGRAFSEDGWPYVDEGGCTWIVVPGTDPPVHLQIQNGPPLIVLGAFAADYNACVEHLRDADSACWTPGNPVRTSNHPGGTSMDLDWDGPDGHTFRYGISEQQAYPGDQARNVRELLEFYEDNVFCGGFWDIHDWMHFQMGGDTYDSEADRPTAKVLDFIARKIRPDGFSTFRRGGTPGTPSHPPVEPAQPALAIGILSRATGITTTKAQEILSQVQFALIKAGCTNPRRIAAALAQWVVESGHFVYTEEIADGPENQPRWKYKGRTWIQLTWEENYRGFSEWCHSLGLVPTPDYFVVRPHELADQKWAALGPAYWWAIKYPRINEYADRGDIDNVSKWVNAPAWVDDPNRHANGEQARRDAYNKALALGDQLLTLITAAPTQPEDDMAQVPQEQWDAFYHAYMDDLPSLSPLRKLGEGKVGPLHLFVRWMDANTHVPLMKLLAGLGHPDTLRDLAALAAADLNTYPDRADGKELANNILADVQNDAKAVVAQATQELQIPNTAPQAIPAPQVTDTRQLEAEIARLSSQFEQLRVAINTPSVSTELATTGETTGAKIARAVDSNMDYSNHVLSMDSPERAVLTRALHSIDPSTNGAQP